MKKILLILIMCSGLIQAGPIKSVEHEFFTKGFRNLVTARINDTAGIYEARVYFKRHNVKNYQVFSLMECKENRCYAELPRTSSHLRKLDYVIVYQNSSGVAFKSKTYTMEKRDMLELPAWQTLNRKEMIVYTEYVKPPKWVNGFTDKMKIQKSDEEEAFGVTAGLYPMSLINPKIEVTCPKCPTCKKQLWE